MVIVNNCFCFVYSLRRKKEMPPDGTLIKYRTGRHFCQDTFQIFIQTGVSVQPWRLLFTRGEGTKQQRYKRCPVSEIPAFAIWTRSGTKVLQKNAKPSAGVFKKYFMTQDISYFATALCHPHAWTIPWVWTVTPEACRVSGTMKYRLHIRGNLV